MHTVVAEVTARIKDRSRDRARTMCRGWKARREGPGRAKLSCANWAHAFAGQSGEDKRRMMDPDAPNIAIVSAYNDMLSAHQPFERFPPLIRAAARAVGATAQFAGGVPAMCDGVTQGQPGMELSLFSRDVIAMATAVALTHDAFDGALCLGICDKIVPGLVMGALSFGHLPMIMVPGGPCRRASPTPRRPGSARPTPRARQSRGTAAGRDGVLPFAGHLHLLRHRQLQPDADGDDGAAPAGLGLRASGHAPARRPDGGGGRGGRWRSARASRPTPRCGG